MEWGFGIFIIFGLIYLCLCLFNPDWYWGKLIEICMEKAIAKRYGRQKARYIIGFMSVLWIITGILLIINIK